MEVAVTALQTWREQPDVMVEQLFKVTPDDWQREALQVFPHKPRIAMKSCAGPGKTCLLAWLCINFLLTRPHPIIGCTSINAANLKANLWTEISRWISMSPLLTELFEQTNTEVRSRQFPQTWKIEARSWARDADERQIGNALAGLHAKYVMWALDESGDYPESILPITEAIFAGSPEEAHIVQAGNPTQTSGALYSACTTGRKLWHVIEITADPDNPKRTPRVSIEHARQQIELYGRDNPWVAVKILGQFPATAFNALISRDEVEASMRRTYNEMEYGAFPKVLGIDVARGGADSSVIFSRQGLQAFTSQKYRNIDGTIGAGLAARKWRDWEADACFIDDTGGFGASWLDNLRRLGLSPIGVHFSEKSGNPQYFNKRTEIIFELMEWIKRGGALPYSQEMLASLTLTTYTHKGDKLIIEPKDLLKEKLGYSPDEMDAAALTFAHPVTKAPLIIDGFVVGSHPTQDKYENYNPFSRSLARKLSAR